MFDQNHGCETHRYEGSLYTSFFFLPIFPLSLSVVCFTSLLAMDSGAANMGEHTSLRHTEVISFGCTPKSRRVIYRENHLIVMEEKIQINEKLTHACQLQNLYC